MIIMIYFSIFLGTFKKDRDATLCQKCEPGWYTTDVASTKCKGCEKNFFCPVSGGIFVTF